MSILYHWAALMLKERQLVARFDPGADRDDLSAVTGKASDPDADLKSVRGLNAQLVDGLLDIRLERANAAKALLMKHDDVAPASHFALVDNDPTLRNALLNDVNFADRRNKSDIPHEAAQNYIALSAAVYPTAWFPDYTSGALLVLAENEKVMRGFTAYDAETAMELADFAAEQGDRSALENLPAEARAERFVEAHRRIRDACDRDDLPADWLDRGKTMFDAIDKALSLVARPQQPQMPKSAKRPKPSPDNNLGVPPAP